MVKESEQGSEVSENACEIRRPLDPIFKESEENLENNSESPEIESEQEDEKKVCLGISEKNYEDSIDSLKPDEMMAKGLVLLAEKKYEDANQLLGESLRRKKTNENLAEGDSLLRRFYLNYGNALLKKEEESGDFFGIECEEANGEKNGETGEGCGGVKDEELAWEILEMARVSYESFFKTRGDEIELNDEGLDREVDDASFVHIRLGDLLLSAEAYGDAEKEYFHAFKLREDHKFPTRKLKSCLISLGQAQLLSLKAEEALKSFTTALEYLRAELKEEHFVEEERKTFEEYAEDMELQISDIKEALDQGIYQKAIEVQKNKANITTSSSSSTKPPECELKMQVLKMYDATLAETSSNFSKPTLDGEIVNLGVVSKKRKHAAAVAETSVLN